MMNRLVLLVISLGFATAGLADEPMVINGKSTYVGGEVNITDPVEGSLQAAGGDITISAPVNGSAHVAGGKVTVKGEIKRDLRAAAGRVVIDGPVGGDVSVAAGTLTLGPNARLAGDLKFRGGTLERDPAAQVQGTIDHVQGHRKSREFDPFRAYTRDWIWTLGLMVLAAIIAGALPGPVKKMATELVAHPWAAPLIGFIALTCIPIAAIVIMITIIGIPLGLLALMAYAALLLIGYVSISVVVGGLLLDHYKAAVASEAAWRILAAVLTVLALGVVSRLPFIGGWIAFAALIAGVGMVMATAFRRENKAEVPPAATTA
jgi:cytoskeletal protein CcmA (bactofilin family)